jgi:type II secretory pathway predicted ATPase ExeA
MNIDQIRSISAGPTCPALAVCSKGYPRLINKLAVRALIYGFKQRAEQITADHVRAAALEYEI